jgi:3-deoxy-7-phosphoheptulonate synthase
MVDVEVKETGPNGDEVVRKEKKEVLSFRGDNVNGYEADDRQPDPERLLGYVWHRYDVH